MVKRAGFLQNWGQLDCGKDYKSLTGREYSCQEVQVCLTWSVSCLMLTETMEQRTWAFTTCISSR